MSHKKKLSQKILLDNGYRKIISKDYDVGNGKIYNYLISSHSGLHIATMIFAITKNKEVIYIKEYREGIENFVYGFPIGILDEGLSLEENAKKELREETGYVGNNIKFLGESIVAYYEENSVKYFFNIDCEFIGQNLEVGEDIEVFTCSLEEFEENIKSGFINCPLTISCFTLAKLKGYV